MKSIKGQMHVGQVCEWEGRLKTRTGNDTIVLHMPSEF